MASKILAVIKCLVGPIAVKYYKQNARDCFNVHRNQRKTSDNNNRNNKENEKKAENRR